MTDLDTYTGPNLQVDDTMRAELEALTDNPPYHLGDIAPGQPVYWVADNPWLPWVNRAAGVAMGAWLASAVTLLLDSDMLRWSLPTSIACTLLFAWLLAGHELFEKRPTKFKQVQ